MKKISIVVFLMSILLITFFYKVFAEAPAEFGDASSTTCFVGGSIGIVNCTGDIISTGGQFKGSGAGLTGLSNLVGNCSAAGSCSNIAYDTELIGNCSADQSCANIVYTSGETITGNIVLDDGTGESPKLQFINQLNNVSSIYEQTDGDLYISAADGFELAGNSFRFTTLTNCDTTDTDGSGVFSCGTDATIANCSAQDSCSLIAYDTELIGNCSVDQSCANVIYTTDSLGNTTLEIEGVCWANVTKGEWIIPSYVIDIDDEDIESDLNTYVDIAGDVMTGDLIVPSVNGSWNGSDEYTKTSEFAYIGNCSVQDSCPLITYDTDLSTYLQNGSTAYSFGADASGEDIFLYFNDDSRDDEYLKWDDASDRFEFSDAVQNTLGFIGGTISGTTFTASSDIKTTGAGDDLWLGTSTQANAKFRAYANGDLYFVNLINGSIGCGNITGGPDTDFCTDAVGAGGDGAGNCSVANSCANILYESELNTLAELNIQLTEAVLVDTVTMTNTKWCKYVSASTDIQCNVNPVTDTSVNTECSGTWTTMDGEGNCDTFLGSVVGDTSPQLGGYLDTNAQNIGSTSDEIEHIYITTNFKIYLGTTQQGEIYYDGSKLIIKVN